MTLAKLIRELQLLKKLHGGRIQVCADTQNLRESCNDVWQIVNVGRIEAEAVEQVDGDGFKKYKSNGEESIKSVIVLRS